MKEYKGIPGMRTMETTIRIRISCENDEHLSIHIAEVIKRLAIENKFWKGCYKSGSTWQFNVIDPFDLDSKVLYEQDSDKPTWCKKCIKSLPAHVKVNWKQWDKRPPV